MNYQKKMSFREGSKQSKGFTRAGKWVGQDNEQDMVKGTGRSK